MQFHSITAVQKRYRDLGRSTLFDKVAKGEFPRPIMVFGKNAWTDEQLDTFDKHLLAQAAAARAAAAAPLEPGAKRPRGRPRKDRTVDLVGVDQSTLEAA